MNECMLEAHLWSFCLEQVNGSSQILGLSWSVPAALVTAAMTESMMSLLILTGSCLLLPAALAAGAISALGQLCGLEEEGSISCCNLSLCRKETLCLGKDQMVTGRACISADLDSEPGQHSRAVQTWTTCLVFMVLSFSSGERQHQLGCIAALVRARACPLNGF